MTLSGNTGGYSNDYSNEQGGSSSTSTGTDATMLSLLACARAGAQAYSNVKEVNHDGNVPFDMGQFEVTYRNTGEISTGNLEYAKLIKARVLNYEKKNKIKKSVCAAPTTVKEKVKAVIEKLTPAREYIPAGEAEGKVPFPYLQIGLAGIAAYLLYRYSKHKK